MASGDGRREMASGGTGCGNVQEAANMILQAFDIYSNRLQYQIDNRSSGSEPAVSEVENQSRATPGQREQYVQPPRQLRNIPYRPGTMMPVNHDRSADSTRR